MKYEPKYGLTPSCELCFYSPECKEDKEIGDRYYDHAINDTEKDKQEKMLGLSCKNYRYGDEDE